MYRRESLKSFLTVSISADLGSFTPYRVVLTSKVPSELQINSEVVENSEDFWESCARMKTTFGNALSSRGRGSDKTVI